MTKPSMVTMSKYQEKYSDQEEMKKYMEMKKKDSSDHKELPEDTSDNKET